MGGRTGGRCVPCAYVQVKGGRERWKERMKTREEGERRECRREKPWGVEEVCARACVCVRMCVCGGGLVDLQIFLVAQIMQKRQSERRRKV